MILREVMITLKYGGKAYVGTKWIGGSPVTVHSGSGNYAPGTLNLGNISGIGNQLYDLNFPDTSAFSLQGEYDLADWLLAAQPTFTGGDTNIVGIAFDPVWGLKTDPATPDGAKFVTVLFFPCIVILSFDNSDKAALGNAINSSNYINISSWDVGSQLVPITFAGSDGSTYSFWTVSQTSGYGTVLAKLNDFTFMVYFHG